MSGGRGPGRRGAPPPEGARLCCFLAVWLWQAVRFFFFFFNFHLFCFYFWLCWIFVSAHGLSLVAVSGGHALIVACGLLIAVASLVGKQQEKALGGQAQ